MNTSTNLGFSEAPRPEHPDDDAAPTVGSVLQGRYRLLAPIARGGMGSVFRGERVGLERPVAIKFLHAEVARNDQLVKRFEVEARAMSRLCHPNCVSVIDYGLEGRPYLVMDLVEGTPLRTLVDGGRLPPRRAIAIAREILAGLEHAHSHGVIHRDIKPENILIEQTPDHEDHIRLLDFGLAKLTDAGSKATVGVCLGTPTYMAPEQMDDKPVDRRVDLYTTGIVLYEMLTGKRPFEGTEVADIFLQQLESTPPPFRKALPGVALPGGLEAIVMRALEKSPAERFASAAEMRDALGRISERLDEAPPAPALSDKTVFEALPLGAQVAPVANAPRGSAAKVVARLRALVGPVRERAARVPWSALVSWCRRRRVLAAGIAAGAVALVVVSLVAVHLRTSRRPAGVVATKPATAGPAAPAGKLAAIDELVARGDRKQALARLRELRKENPADADYPAAQARLLFELRRYEEGLAAFRSAIRRDPQRRGDTALIRLVIDSLQNDGFAPAAEDFLRELGSPARAEVKEAARTHASARVRERARDLLRDWGRRPLFR